MTNFICTLPDEILLTICDHLSDRDLIQLGRTCHRFRVLTQDPSLWRKFCLHYFPALPHYTYRDYCRESNLRNKLAQEIYAEKMLTLSNYMDPYTQLIPIDDTKIAVKSTHLCTIYFTEENHPPKEIWGLYCNASHHLFLKFKDTIYYQNLKLLSKIPLIHHETIKNVTLMASSHQFLALAHYEGTVEIWDWKDLRPLTKLPPSLVPIIKLFFNQDENLLLILDNNYHCKIWDTETHTITDVREFPLFNQIVFDKKHFFLSIDMTYPILHFVLNEGKFLHSWSMINSSRLIGIHRNKLLTVSIEGFILSTDLETREEYQYDIHITNPCTFTLNKDLLTVSYSTGVIQIFDLHQKKIVGLLSHSCKNDSKSYLFEDKLYILENNHEHLIVKQNLVIRSFRATYEEHLHKTIQLLTDLKIKAHLMDLDNKITFLSLKTLPKDTLQLIQHRSLAMHITEEIFEQCPTLRLATVIEFISDDLKELHRKVINTLCKIKNELVYLPIKWRNPLILHEPCSVSSVLHIIDSLLERLKQITQQDLA